MATKSELKALSTEKFPTNGQGGISAADHREFNEALIDSVALEGQSGGSLDLGVVTKLFSAEGPASITIDYYQELLNAADPNGEIGPSAIKNGQVITVECFLDTPGDGPTERHIYLEDRTGALFAIPPLLAGGADLDMTFSDMDNLPWSVMVTITAIIPTDPSNTFNLPRVLINAAQYVHPQ